MVLDDFVMLGKTVPEPNSDGRTMVCSAGVSAQLRQLVRIYPLSRFSAPPRWRQCTVKLERNPKDSRLESWALAGDRTPDAHDDINRDAFKVGAELHALRRADLLTPFGVGSIEEANERRISLAVLHPSGLGPDCLEFEHNPESPDSPQLSLFPGPEVQGAKRFPFIPRIRFTDAGTERCLMIRDWGVYELMRKTSGFELRSDSDRRNWMAGALHLDASSSLFVGNFNRHRNSWLVISVLRGLRASPCLFDELNLTGVAA